MSALWNKSVLEHLERIAKALEERQVEQPENSEDKTAPPTRTDAIELLNSIHNTLANRTRAGHHHLLKAMIILIALLALSAAGLAWGLYRIAAKPTPESMPSGTSGSTCWFCPTLLTAVNPTRNETAQHTVCFRSDWDFRVGSYKEEREINDAEWKPLRRTRTESLSSALRRASMVFVIGSHDARPLRYQTGPNRLDSNIDLAQRRANTVLNALTQHPDIGAALVIPIAMSELPPICTESDIQGTTDGADRRKPRIIVHFTGSAS